MKKKTMGKGRSDGVQGIKDIARWLQTHRRLLIITHIRPDGDAFGSQLGLLRLLRRAGHWKCEAYLTNGLPQRYRELFALAPGEIHTRGIVLEDFDGMICLDTATWERADVPVKTSRPPALVACCNIDHHPDNSRYGQPCWIAEKAATAQMVLELAVELGLPVTPDVATPLHAGILTDSGGFRYSNTSPAVLRDAAVLIEAGADHETIVDQLFMCEKYGRLKLKSELLETARFAFDGRLVYAVLLPSMLEKYNVEPADTENIIDVLRVIEGVALACLLQPEEDGVRLSLRARSMQFPAAVVARAMGGGGHPLAAGARLSDPALDKAVAKLLEEAGKVFSL